jgi:hypothetical protein
MKWMSPGVDGSGRKLRTLQRSGGWRLEHLEWVPTRLHGTGWKLRTVPRSLKSALTAADAATFSVTRTDQGGGKRHVAAIHYCLFFAAADGVGRILPHGSDFFSASGIFHLS